MGFDPLLHAADLKAHPEAYCKVSDLFRDMLVLHSILTCKSLPELEGRFRLAFRCYRYENDMDMLKRLTETKGKRKATLIK